MTAFNQERTSNTTESSVVFAADLGGTHLRTAAVDAGGRIHFRHKQNTPETAHPEEIVHALVAAVRECERQCAAAGESIRALSVVAPGSVNVAAGIIVKAPNLPCLNGFALAGAFTK